MMHMKRTLVTIVAAMDAFAAKAFYDFCLAIATMLRHALRDTYGASEAWPIETVLLRAMDLAHPRLESLLFHIGSSRRDRTCHVQINSLSRPPCSADWNIP